MGACHSYNFLYIRLGFPRESHKINFQTIRLGFPRELLIIGWSSSFLLYIALTFRFRLVSSSLIIRQLLLFGNTTY